MHIKNNLKGHVFRYKHHQLHSPKSLPTLQNFKGKAPIKTTQKALLKNESLAKPWF